MATLIENATRITNALADIKQAIINKGVTPTGKCETFSTAINNIPAGSDNGLECLFVKGDSGFRTVPGIGVLMHGCAITDDGISVNGGNGSGIYCRRPIDKTKYTHLIVALDKNINGQIGTITISGSLPTAITSGDNRRAYKQTTLSADIYPLENSYGFYYGKRVTTTCNIIGLWLVKA